MEKKTEKFLAIIDGNIKLIYKIVNGYCKNKALHEDLIQEIILQLWLSFENYDHQFKISTWIYRVALNSAISFYRKGQNERKLSSEFLPQHENMVIEETTFEEDPNLNLLNKFIQELKEIDKALILLYLDEFSQKEIADIMGMSPSNVGTRINRIKNKLRNKFQSNLK